MTSTHLRGALLLTALVCASGCAILDALEGVDQDSDADMSVNADMSSPDLDMTTLDMADLVDQADASPDLGPDAAPDDMADLADDMGDDMTTAPTPQPSTIALGDAHTCALHTAGQVWCWGHNDNGQRAAPANNNAAPAPAQVALNTAADSIAAGREHTCALAGGKLYCWGANSSGQLGDETTTTRIVSTEVKALTDVEAVAAGGDHTCAIQGGKLYCWGANSQGQLGTSSAGGSRSAPAEVREMTAGVTAVAAGGDHTCAIKSGALYCWGANNIGQIGDSSTEPNRTIPSLVTGMMSGVTAVSVGVNNTCAIQGGKLYCWGANYRGQLGDGMTSNNATRIPSPVDDMEAGVEAVAVGANHVCAIKNGGLYCWGDDDKRQLGDGSLFKQQNPLSTEPKLVAGLEQGVTEVISGGEHTCARHMGTLKCWGFNHKGQLATRNLDDIDRPTEVTPRMPPVADNATLIVAGDAFACSAVSAPAQLLCWGDGTGGQLGDGQRAPTYKRSYPRPVTGITSGITALAAGETHACAIVNGKIKCWGGNMYGRLGDGIFMDSSTPVDVLDLPVGYMATDLALGDRHTCALVNGGAWCWGYNFSGELGSGSTMTTHQAPQRVMGMANNVTAIAAGGSHTCAIKSGGLFCWGSDSDGQLGDGAGTGHQIIPVQVEGLTSGVTAVFAGNDTTCAVHNGELKCWGANSVGQLTNGGNADQLSPVTINNLGSPISAVAIGSSHICAVAGEALYCWGRGDAGRLGNGNTTTRTNPTAVNGAPTDIQQLTSHASYTCARRTGGQVLCWGANGAGQLGVGVVEESTPRVIPLP